MTQGNVIGLTGFQTQDTRNPGAFIETGSLHPPLAALRLLPFLGLSPR